MMGIGDSYFLSYFSNLQWAIDSNMFSIFEKILNNKYISSSPLSDPQAKIQKAGYSQIGDKAIIPIKGTLLKRNYMMEAPSGSRTLENIQDDFKLAYNDPSVKMIVADIDSPGGATPGLEETESIIKTVKEKKKVIAHTSGQMCSAAYWLGSACSERYSSELASIGSIGVYRMHIDKSALLEKEGVKVTYIKAGSKKTQGNEFESLSDETIIEMQADVDRTYDIFMKRVARNLNVDFETVKTSMADGEVFNAEKALARGMIDGFSTLEDIINY